MPNKRIELWRRWYDDELLRISSVCDFMPEQPITSYPWMKRKVEWQNSTMCDKEKGEEEGIHNTTTEGLVVECAFERPLTQRGCWLRRIITRWIFILKIGVNSEPIRELSKTASLIKVEYWINNQHELSISYWTTLLQSKNDHKSWQFYGFIHSTQQSAHHLQFFSHSVQQKCLFSSSPLNWEMHFGHSNSSHHKAEAKQQLPGGIGPRKIVT